MFSGINVSEFSLVLFTGLAEMIVSFLHMMFADNLGRLLYIIFPIKSLFYIGKSVCYPVNLAAVWQPWA